MRKKTKNEFSYTRSYNSLGLRGPEPYTSKQFYNIVALGDSFTEGVGVSEDSTWFRLYISILQKNKPVCNYQGINGAISGSDLFFEFVKLRDILLRYNPKAVILSINSSDIYDTYIRGDFKRFKSDGSVEYNKAPYWEPLYAASFIFRYIVDDIVKLENNPYSGKMNQNEKNAIVNSLCNCITENYLHLSENHQFSLFIIFHPLQHETGYASELFLQCAEKISVEKNIVLINLFEEWDSLFKDNNIHHDDVYWKSDKHHKPYGNLLWAKMVARKTENLFDCN